MDGIRNYEKFLSEKWEERKEPIISASFACATRNSIWHSSFYLCSCSGVTNIALSLRVVGKNIDGIQSPSGNALISQNEEKGINKLIDWEWNDGMSTTFIMWLAEIEVAKSFKHITVINVMLAILCNNWWLKNSDYSNFTLI